MSIHNRAIITNHSTVHAQISYDVILDNLQGITKQPFSHEKNKRAKINKRIIMSLCKVFTYFFYEDSSAFLEETRQCCLLGLLCRCCLFGSRRFLGLKQPSQLSRMWRGNGPSGECSRVRVRDVMKVSNSRVRAHNVINVKNSAA